jgi:hypothetical protein
MKARTRFLDYSELKTYTESYGRWVEEHIEDSWSAYLLTFMFNQMSGSPKNIADRQLTEIHLIYSWALTRCVRNPRSASNAEKLPKWIAAPDLPVAKSTKSSLKDVTLNEGVHAHAIALIHPDSRSGLSFEELFVNHMGELRSRGSVQRIDVQPITRDPVGVTRYALKAVENGRLSWDAILVLPRSRSELAPRGERVRDGM